MTDHQGASRRPAKTSAASPARTPGKPVAAKAAAQQQSAPPLAPKKTTARKSAAHVQVAKSGDTKSADTKSGDVKPAAKAPVAKAPAGRHAPGIGAQPARKVVPAKRPAAGGKAATRPLISLKALGGGRFSLQAPPCAIERTEDLEEVHDMIAHDEPELAQEELLYLVADCRAFFPAHNLLGDLALAEDKLSMARGHYGFVYELTLQALPPGFRGKLPAKVGYNRDFFTAGKQLARCLATLNDLDGAADVLRRLSEFDPRDRDVQELLVECEAARKPGPAVHQLVSLQLPVTPQAIAAADDFDEGDDDD